MRCLSKKSKCFNIAVVNQFNVPAAAVFVNMEAIGLNMKWSKC